VTAARRRACAVAGLILGLLTISAGTPTSADAADKPKGAITIQTTTPRHSKEMRDYLLMSSGVPPSTATLTDTSGEHTVTATVQATDGGACAGQAPRYTGLGTDPWCVHLDGVQAGYEVTGTLSGDTVDVALTVKARIGIWGPALVTLIGLLAAAFLAWLANTLLPAVATDLLWRRSKFREKGITGLKAWAGKATTYLSKDDVIARVRWAKRTGKRLVVGARRALRQELESDTTRLPDCPLRQAADTEVRRNDVRVGDMLTETGLRSTSDAERLLTAVSQATRARAAFDEIADGLMTRIPPAQLQQAARLKQDGDELAEGYLSEFTLDLYLEELRGYASDIQKLAEEKPQSTTDLVVAFAATNLSHLGSLQRAAAAGRQLGGAVAGVALPVAEAGVALLLTLTLMAVGAFAVLVAQYLPNDTFGTDADYITLLASTFASATGAAVASALVQLRGPKAWYG